jgi:hypothetical protein
MMARLVAILLVGWSLVATPGLCRAGVRIGCCAEPARQSSATAEPRGDCSDRGCPSDAHPDRHENIPTAPAPCGSCASVCSPVVGLIQLSGAAQLVTVAVPITVSCVDVDEGSSSWRRLTCDLRTTKSHAHFSSNNPPLLI